LDDEIYLAGGERKNDPARARSEFGELASTLPIAL
jgi:hypothetical protein